MIRPQFPLFLLVMSIHLAACHRSVRPNIPEVPDETLADRVQTIKKKMPVVVRQPLSADRMVKSANEQSANKPQVVYKDFVFHLHQTADGLQYIIGHQVEDQCSDCDHSPATP